MTYVGKTKNILYNIQCLLRVHKLEFVIRLFLFILLS